MRSFWGLIPKYLWKSKKRNFFIAVGIILSISLIVSLSIMIDSVKKSSHERLIKDAGGDYDVFFFARNKAVLEGIRKEPVVKEMSKIAYLQAVQLPQSKYSLEINGYDKNIINFLQFKLIKGSYPKTNQEIALEAWFLNTFPKQYHVGDKIILPINASEEGSKTQEFVLSGIFEHQFNTNTAKNIGKAYVTRDYVESLSTSQRVLYKGYLVLDPSYPMQKAFNLLPTNDSQLGREFHLNSGKAFLEQSYQSLDRINRMLYVVIGVVASVIIYNIFNVSVTERIREFGMLRALGTPPGEIQALVLGEGFILGSIFIPIGIITGNIVVRTLITIVSGYKGESGILHIPASTIITSFVVGFSTIFLGTYFPAKKASQVSPMEAIHSGNNLGLKGKNIKKNSKQKDFLSKHFGFTAEMAYLNLNRNKKRFITTTISLSISIILVMAVNYILTCGDPLKTLKGKIGGDFAITTRTDDFRSAFSPKEIQEIEQIKGIASLKKFKTSDSFLQVSKDKITHKGYKVLETQSKRSEQAQYDFQKERFKFRTEVKGYPMGELEKIQPYIIEGKINEKEMTEKPLVILGQNLNYSSNTSLKVGDEIQLEYGEYNSRGDNINISSKKFTIAALLEEDYRTDDFNNGNVVFLSDTIAEEYLNMQGYHKIQISLSKDADYKEVEKVLKEKLKGNRGATLLSYKEEVRRIKKDGMQNSLIMYSFVIVVGIVSMINLFNIMSMNAILRKKEMGVLRALGFGKGEVRKVLMQEGVFYALTATFWGAGLGTLFTYLFFLLTRTALTEGMSWRFPLGMITGIFAVVAAICIFASVAASKHISSTSTVDAIRGIE